MPRALRWSYGGSSFLCARCTSIIRNCSPHKTSLRRAEQQLADKVLLTVDANSEVLSFRISEAGNGKGPTDGHFQKQKPGTAPVHVLYRWNPQILHRFALAYLVLDSTPALPPAKIVPAALYCCLRRQGSFVACCAGFPVESTQQESLDSAQLCTFIHEPLSDLV